MASTAWYLRNCCQGVRPSLPPLRSPGQALASTTAPPSPGLLHATALGKDGDGGPALNRGRLAAPAAQHRALAMAARVDFAVHCQWLSGTAHSATAAQPVARTKRPPLSSGTTRLDGASNAASVAGDRHLPASPPSTPARRRKRRNGADVGRLGAAVALDRDARASII